MRHTIDGAMYRRMLLSAAAAIAIHKEEINQLNVFPVPDGDTGTNMSMTMNAAAAELRSTEDPTLGKAVSVSAAALLRGARGNSGVILSLLFRGISKVLKTQDTCDGLLFVKALQEGVDSAYKAVMRPAEGTILTVARVSAAEAAKAQKESFEEALTLVLEFARKALANTVRQNPVLQRAGVVDAGGKGWVYVLEGMLCALQGEDLLPPAENAQTQEGASFSEFQTEEITFGYCTEFIVSRDNNLEPEALRSYLCGMGDCLVLVEDDEIIKVHVHTNEPGTVIQKALEYGALITVKIENMRLQHTEKVLSEKELTEQEAEPEKPYGIVSVCAGDGLAAVFRDLGADRIISGGQTMNPSTEDILRQIKATPAETVFVLPNNTNIILAAEQAVPLTKKKVIVIHSKTIPQGITAALNFDPELDVETLTQAMTEALSTVETVQITYAARESQIDGREIHAGDYLVLHGKEMLGTGADLKALLETTAKRIAGDGREYITIYSGSDVTQEEAEQAQAVFTQLCPDADVNLVYGGQPVYYYLISAE